MTFAGKEQKVFKLGLGQILFSPDTGYPADFLCWIFGFRPDIWPTIDDAVSIGAKNMT